jgi:hypothetical protein
MIEPPETVELTESLARIVVMSETAAIALQALGRRLASSQRWYGESEDDPMTKRSVIHCEPVGHERYRVVVSNAVGVVAVKGLQLVVKPKIPTDHLLFLMSKATIAPRPDVSRVTMESGESFVALMCRWATEAAERTIRAGVVRDYEGRRETLPAPRGRIEPLATTRMLAEGRIGADCEFDDFDEDNPLNRVLREGMRVVLAMPSLDLAVLKRASRVRERLTTAGVLRATELQASLDRNSSHYADALALSVALIAGSGRSLVHGGTVAFGFLLPTARVVEQGVRELLREALGKDRVSQPSIPLGAAGVAFTPDLGFDRYGDGVTYRAVGDVKYKLAGGDWRYHRPDLYQAVAFAEAAGAAASAIVRFRRPGGNPLPSLTAGGIIVREVAWIADPALPAATAAANLVADIQAWLEGQPHVVPGTALVA